jgi:NAD(P)-dependent dehydrogenase (short-subunit alcohol dehydrogenase family)
MRDPSQADAGQFFGEDGAQLNIDVRELDVTDADSIAQCVAAVVKDYGRVDVLINNAGIHLLGAMEDMSEESFRCVFETNFFGPVNLARAVLPHMRKRGHGRIITVSSIGSLVGRVIDGVYCASKSALETAFEAMKYEVQRFGIQVSVVCPSAFRTDIGDRITTQVTPGDGSPYAALLGFRRGKVHESLAAGGDPQEVASLIRQIAAEPEPQFRYIVGEKAQVMQQALTGLGDAERQQLIKRLAEIDWWVSGATNP